MTSVWQKNRLLFSAAITILVLFFPVSLFHEYGHILVCESNGYDYEFFMGDLAFNVVCSDTPQPILLYFVIGGVFGMILSGGIIPFVINQKGILIGCSVTCFDQFQKALFETVAHSAYLSSDVLFIGMGVLSGLFFLALYRFYYNRINQNSKNNKPDTKQY